MKKSVRNILIMAAVLVVLGGGLALLLALPQAPSEDASSAVSSQPAAELTTVMDKKLEDVASLSVKNKEDEFVLVRDGDGFTVKGYEGMDVLTDEAASSVNSVASFRSSRDLGVQENLAEFGLTGEEAVTLELRYQDGSSDQLTVGIQNARTAGRYVLKDGNVYITNGISEKLLGSRFGYFNAELYTVPDREPEEGGETSSGSKESLQDILYNLKLSGAQFPEPVEISFDTSVINAYVITSPITAESGDSGFTDIISALKAPKAEGVAAAGITPETLAEFGLDQPQAVAEFDMNNQRHVLSVSQADSQGKRYLLLDDRDMVYQVNNSAVSAWAETDLMKLRMSYIWLVNIKEAEKLTMTVDGRETYSYDVTRTENKEKSTENNIQYDLAVKNARGQDIDYEIYQDFYKQLISVTVLNMNRVEYSGTPAFRVEFRKFEGNGTDVVEYYKAGDDRYAAVLNGGFNGLVRRTAVDKIISLLPLLDENKPVE